MVVHCTYFGLRIWTKHCNFTFNSSCNICATAWMIAQILWFEYRCVTFKCCSFSFLFTLSFSYTLFVFPVVLYLQCWLSAFLSSSSIAGWCKRFWMLGRKMTKSSKSFSSIYCHWFIYSVSLARVLVPWSLSSYPSVCQYVFDICLLADYDFST